MSTEEHFRPVVKVAAWIPASNEWLRELIYTLEPKDAPMEPQTPAALGDETGGADGAGGLSPSPPVTNASHHSKNRGGRP